jgi:lipoate-protein ligase B
MQPSQRLFRLRHLHLPSLHPHYVPYSLASRVQEHLRRKQLAFKDAAASGSTISLSPPPPALISFTPAPVYTLGRRQTEPLDQAELARLTAPLEVATPLHFGPTPAPTAETIHLQPHVTPSPRGGLTTYHGPGQVVLWPVIDLKSVGPEAAAAAAARLSCCAPPTGGGLTVRTYARLLETTTMSVLNRVFGLRSTTTEDPGVWVTRRRREREREREQGQGQEEELAKVAALGVHLRRHITALGTAVNVAMPGSDGLGSDGEETRNPWTRIVPCGLPGKEVTSVAWEFARRSEGLDGEGFRVGVGVVDEMLLQQVRPGRIARTREQAVAEVWAEVFAGGIGLGNEDPDGGVEMVDTEEVLGLMEELTRLAEKTGDGQDGQVTPEEAEYLGRIRMLL